MYYYAYIFMALIIYLNLFKRLCVFNAICSTWIRLVTYNKDLVQRRATKT